MRIAVVGQGAREHALCWALAKSPCADAVVCIPGSDAIVAIAQCKRTVDPDDHAAVAALCAREHIDMVVIGPEQYLANGLSDALRAANIPVFGPSQAAAQLESAKSYMKALCIEANIPTADFQVFDDSRAALAYVRALSCPIVIKADGLAQGKGVVIAETHAAAEEAIVAIMDTHAFGTAAGKQVVIESFLSGTELSCFVLLDGAGGVRFLASAQDYKRAYENDRGPNTGGMGSISPSPLMTDALQEEVLEHIAIPIDRTMRARGTPYCGVLYIGLMSTKNGLFVIECNARFGDPEIQAIVPLIDGDFAALCYATAKGRLHDNTTRTTCRRASVCVVLAADGYPVSPRTGTVVRGVRAAEAMPNVHMFHAATTKEDDAHWIARGGRVLSIVGVADTTADAGQYAYAAVDTIDWPEGFFRSDIGKIQSK